jgi:hypothetical protein
MMQLPVPPERPIHIPHPIESFSLANKDIIHPNNTIHTQLYDYIHQAHPITETSIQTRFPFLPNSFIIESLRCHEPLLEYS